MTTPIKLRRSLLYMPASNARALEKARNLPCDGVIFDLEDAVVPDLKADALKRACDAVRTGGYGGREVIIRANAIDSIWFEDEIEAIAKAGPDGILIPKVNDAGDVLIVRDRLNDLGASEQLFIWAMMETPGAILNVRDIARLGGAEKNRLKGFIIGTNDLAKEIGCQPDPAAPPLIDALSVCVLGARAFNLAVIDGVYNDIADVDGFERACIMARHMGFDGKSLIHPSQIDICNKTFTPSSKEVAKARAIIAAFDKRDNQRAGAIMHEGRMVERLHLDIARTTVARAEAAQTGDKP